MAVNKKLYDKDSIESLSPLEFTRLRPQVYAGDCTYSTQLLVEIISNAIDEYRLGNGNIIEVNINDDIVRVSDNGQGFIPNLMRDDGKTVLEAAFSVLNTSGKYHEDGVYEGTSLGSFGIGCKIATYLSHWLEVSTQRDGVEEKILFTEGVFSKRDVSTTKNNNGAHGTSVLWKPSEEFFTHTEIEIEKVRKLFKTTACLCPGLAIELNYNGKKETFHSTRGLNDLVDEAVGNDEILKNRFDFRWAEGKNKLEAVITYTNRYSSSIIPYVNTGLTESGPHITQIKTSITRSFNKWLREKKLLKDKEANLTGDDIQEGMYLVFNLTAPGVGYDAQVKSRITKLDMRPYTEPFIEAFEDWLNVNEKEIKGVAEKALSARKAREAAKKARDAIRQPKEKGLKAKLALSKKFTDCESKNPKERNLLLVEGNSAATSAIEARNTKTDCIYMLRGKVISPLKTEVAKILQNQEMSDIIKVIGAGFGNDFDVNKMNFNKIVITSDQDSDGADIELLLLTFFYTYMRPLVEAGKLYRAVTPLYIIRQRDKEYYCYSEAELAQWKETHSGSYDLLRAKGLGELNAVDLHQVCFLNERYKRITISDAKKATELLEILQGPSVEPRKKYIYENATELGFEFD